MAKPEQLVQKAILEWLAVKRIYAMRMQTGAVVSTYKGKTRAIQFGIQGQADILALYPCYDCNRGVIPTWIEVKSNIGRQSELQRSFEVDVVSRGHCYILARSVDDVENALRGI